MLDVALGFLTDELNAFLRARTGGEFGKAELRQLVDDAGKWTEPKDRVIALLVNVEEERTFRSQVPQATFVDGRNVVLQPDVKLDLTVLLAAYFQKYDVALTYLSHVYTFFQSHSTFSSDRYAALDSGIERLNVELQSLGYEQLNQLWAFVGAKQLPSAVYRVRLVVVQDVEPREIRPPITEISGEVRSR